MISLFQKLLRKKSGTSTNKPIDFMVDIADVDYITARFLLHTGFIYPILFHSHQAIEKYLKALLIQNGSAYPSIHSLKRLLTKTRKIGAMKESEVKAIKEFLAMLDKQYETSRYGGEAKYNFFRNITQLFVIENGKERKASEQDFKIGNIIMLAPNHQKMLDKTVATIRPKISKTTINHLKDIIDDNPSNPLVQGWKLSVNDSRDNTQHLINIASIIKNQNNYLDELRK